MGRIITAEGALPGAGSQPGTLASTVIVDISELDNNLAGVDPDLQSIIEEIDEMVTGSASADAISIVFDSSGEIVPGDTYGLVWTDSVLRVVPAYGIAHLPSYTIIDNSGVEFKPAAVTRIDDNTIDIDFGPIIPITGEWTLMLSTGGVGQKGDTGEAGEAGAAGEAGENGLDGDSAYVYIAYASDNSGTGFTTTFNASLEYIAILSTDTEIVSPAVGDFSGLWCKYKGADGEDGAGGLTTYDTLTNMELSTAESDGDLVWCTSLATLYQRLDAGSAYTRDGTFVCNTGSGGNTRFVGKAGAYTYAAANFKSVVMAISRPFADPETTGRAVTSADFGKVIPVNSSSVQTMPFPSVGATDHGKAFGIAQIGSAGVQCDRADTDTITDTTKTSIRTNEQGKVYWFTYYHPSTMWLLDNGGDWITTP